MDATFHTGTFYGYLVKGNLHGALAYLRQFPACAQLQQRYLDVFAQDKAVTYPVSDRLNAILAVYQRYWRAVFYQNVPAHAAEQAMRRSFLELLRVDDGMTLDEIEDTAIYAAFAAEQLHFLGGQTGGYYGPYIWKTSEDVTYEVALPERAQAYTVRFLSGFLTKSWLDYLSFGGCGTGGWAGSDGVICCVKDSYDTDSENFTVSLLKHEAQHVLDKTRWPSMSACELEYRAKLVELIYSRERSLLAQFLHEAGGAKEENGHAMAAERIVQEFAAAQNCARSDLSALCIGDIQRTATALFRASSQTMQKKYGPAATSSRAALEQGEDRA